VSGAEDDAMMTIVRKRRGEREDRDEPEVQAVHVNALP
jgi:hypothetical protein